MHEIGQWYYSAATQHMHTLTWLMGYPGFYLLLYGLEHILQLNGSPVGISNDKEDNKSMKQLDNHYNHLRAALNCV